MNLFVPVICESKELYEVFTDKWHGELIQAKSPEQAVQVAINRGLKVWSCLTEGLAISRAEYADEDRKSRYSAAQKVWNCATKGAAMMMKVENADKDKELRYLAVKIEGGDHVVNANPISLHG